jgi:6-methylsalicylate decarboxylase
MKGRFDETAVALPYASHRLAELARVFRPDAAKPADILASFQRF